MKILVAVFAIAGLASAQPAAKPAAPAKASTKKYTPPGPPDGQIPLTAEAQKRIEDLRAYNRLHPADGPENRGLSERCLTWATAGPPMLPGAYNNNYQVTQTPGYFVIANEMVHDVRVI